MDQDDDRDRKNEMNELRRALLALLPGLALADTASVFGEMLTFRSMLDKTTDKKQRFAMLSSKVEDMLNTVVRQIASYEPHGRINPSGRITLTRLQSSPGECRAQ